MIGLKNWQLDCSFTFLIKISFPTWKYSYILYMFDTFTIHVSPHQIVLVESLPMICGLLSLDVGHCQNCRSKFQLGFRKLTVINIINATDLLWAIRLKANGPYSLVIMIRCKSLLIIVSILLPFNSCRFFNYFQIEKSQ